jgi:aspartokinase
MTNINQEVWKFIDKSPSIKRTMSYGLINKRALANYIKTQINLQTNLDAIISAIRRYNIENYDNLFLTAQKMITHTTDLSTRSNLVNVVLSKDTEIQKLIPEFFSIIKYDRGDVLRIIQADESIKVLINEKNLKKILKALPKEKILMIDENLAEINLHLTNEAKYTPGVLAIITNELALNGVSIVEVLSCFPELLWFVYQSDLLKAYNVLYQLCQPNKK